MPRPEKTNIDWFPHPVAHGRKMALMERKYGNNGYAVWFKILEEIGSSETKCLSLRDEVQIELYAARCLVEPETFMQIVADLIRWGEFDQTLWTSRRVLYSKKFIKSVSEVYRKRKTPPPSTADIIAAFDPVYQTEDGDQKTEYGDHGPHLKPQASSLKPDLSSLPKIETCEDIRRHHPITVAMAMSGETEETNLRAVNTWKKYLRILSQEDSDRGIRMFRDVLDVVLGETKQGEVPNIGKAITAKLRELCK